MMSSQRKQPDGPLFELLVGLAWKRNGWDNVEFLTEKRGGPRTPDILVSKARRAWAVECRRMVSSTYAKEERLRGMKLAGSCPRACLDRYLSYVIEVLYKVELATIPDDYLVQTVDRVLKRRLSFAWNDERSQGIVRPVEWDLTRGVMADDFVYYGGSRMLELLTGVSTRNRLQHGRQMATETR